ncbi:MAG: hypothetical protein IJ180_02290 [Bacteroidales bacterium]|nr:hypothetical protein [Bacteroidales bacterium]
MKKIKKILLTALFLLSPFMMMAQPPTPPTGENTPGGDNDAQHRHDRYSIWRTPVSSGTTIMFVLGVATLAIGVARNNRKYSVNSNKEIEK